MLTLRQRAWHARKASRTALSWPKQALQLRAAAKVLRRDGLGGDGIARLHRAWGNEEFSADPEYVNEVARLALHRKSVLECGTGLTTIVLGVLGVPTWSLEHHRSWRRRVWLSLVAVGARGVRTSYAPLVAYGSVEWYRIPDRIPDQFDLVICDGPPETTKGGRRGLWVAVGDRITGATVLLDDAHRSDEAALVEELCGLGWDHEMLESGRKATAVLTKRQTG